MPARRETTDGRRTTDGRTTDGRMDGRTDGRMDGRCVTSARGAEDAGRDAVMKRRGDARWCARAVGGALNIALVGAVVTYVMWVLVGTVAWISHLGERARWLGARLPAKGYPSREAARSAAAFARRNVPLSLVFVIPHSVCLPSRMRRYFGSHGRLVYNFVSAVTLHAFLMAFTPLKTPVVMTMPFNERFHDALSIGCLAFATYAFVRTPASLGLLGVSSAIGLRGEKYANPAAGMDAITWMGVTTWRLGGAGAFVLFTGLSIIPAKLTLGDCITRCVAAIYLRQRSRSFRRWVEKIEDIHLFTWILRGVLLSFACYSALQGDGDVRAAGMILFGASALAAILRLAESERQPERSTHEKTVEMETSPSRLDQAPAACVEYDRDKRD